VAFRATIAQSVLRRMIGLLGRRSLASGEALILPGCRSIHTWFMQFPIDVIFVDRQWRVVAIRQALPPWRLSPIVWQGWAVVELAAGSLQQSRVAVGDRLLLEPVEA